MTRSLTCLTYHDIAPSLSDATRFLGSTTSPEALAQQLDYLQRQFALVDLDAVLSGELPERAALLTFDDAYASIARIAAPILKARRLPAVFFANPGPIMQQLIPVDCLASVVSARFGVEALVRIAAPHLPVESGFKTVMDAVIARMSLDDLARVKTRLLARLERSEAELHRDLGIFMSPRELADLPGQGIEVANHTFSHVHCAPLNKAELQTEIAASKTAIEEMTARPVRAFAFPWGRQIDATPDAMSVIRDSGHRATFLVHGRINLQKPAPDMWYRLPIANETGWALRQSLHVMPRLREIKARVRQRVVLTRELA